MKLYSYLNQQKLVKIVPVKATFKINYDQITRLSDILSPSLLNFKEMPNYYLFS